ncbi:glycerol-3-phosphate dehydrogenase [NAD(+)], cytoplasmic-like [Argonauta hians]
MYMYEEIFEGKNLSEIFNKDHVNAKYLPGVKLPDNIFAEPNISKAVEGADILLFVIPHQFIRGVCLAIKGHIKNKAIAVSLTKGFYLTDGGLKFLSNIISDSLQIPCSVLIGANFAMELVNESFCEATIGCQDKDTATLLKTLFSTNYFRCSVVEDVITVEACGALKNIVAVGAGIIDGLKLGRNTKAAILRIGMLEIVNFNDTFFKDCNLRTYFESCGFANLVATAYGGRNKRLGETLVYTTKSIAELESEILNGQSFQGPIIAKEVYELLKSQNMIDKFPLFVAVNLVCERKMKSTNFVPYILNAPYEKTFP